MLTSYARGRTAFCYQCLPSPPAPPRGLVAAGTIRTGEGLGPTIPKKLLNPYCVVALDYGQRVVTSAKFATKAPFFGEEFFFDTAITDQTSRVSIYINTQLPYGSKLRDCRLGTCWWWFGPKRHAMVATHGPR